MTAEVGSPEFWVGRLLLKLSDRLQRYDQLNKWAIGDHPLPEGDTRYVRALKDLQQKSKTNYVGLALKATTQRMRVRTFKFGGEVDDRAMEIWKSNHMEVQSAIAIADAAKLSDSYALVSGPDEESDGLPVITIEDPRQCVIEADPIRPMKSVAGLKVYLDDVRSVTVIVLYLPQATYTFHGPHPGEDFDLTRVHSRISKTGLSQSGYETVSIVENAIGIVPLVRGKWQPDTEFAECEDGAFEVQDRINHTMLARLVITKSQAYRQRMVSGTRIPKGPDGRPTKPPFDPGADALWVTEDKDAKLWDLEQADIKQLLEAIRDDVGDFAALTQTPVNFLTNKISNVSGDTLQIAQHSHVAKIRRRQDAMGWYFEQVMKICYRYLGDKKAHEVDAEVQWQDPEVHTLAEFADLAAKFATADIPMDLVMERLGFSPEEIATAKLEIERKQQEERDHEIAKEEAKAVASQQRFENGSKSSASTSKPASKPSSTKK